MPKDMNEIVVTIDGTKKNKQEAANLIIEQVELFKNGGPVIALTFNDS